MAEQADRQAQGAEVSVDIESDHTFDCSLWQVAGFTFDISYAEDRQLLDIALDALREVEEMERRSNE